MSEVNKVQLMVYVGKKPFKSDTVAGTGIVWAGFGDVQEVPHKPAVIMMRHPDVWLVKAKFDALTKSGELKEPVAGLARFTGEDAGDGGYDLDDFTDDGSESVEKEQALHALLVEMINTNSAEDFTDTNQPKLDVVRAKLGEEVSKKELNAAWKKVSGE